MFDPTEDLEQRLDYRLLLNGPVSLFWKAEVLATTCAWLEDHTYHVVTLDASVWTDREALHTAFAEALDFPAYYGRNLNALNDCLSDVADGAYGVGDDAMGLALVMVGFDHWHRRDPDLAHRVLDLVADRSRYAALRGRPLLCLVQSDDPTLRIPPVGATSVEWNPSEWMDSTRRE